MPQSGKTDEVEHVLRRVARTRPHPTSLCSAISHGPDRPVLTGKCPLDIFPGVRTPKGEGFWGTGCNQASPLGKLAFAQQMTEEVPVVGLHIDRGRGADRNGWGPLPSRLRRSTFPKGEGFWGYGLPRRSAPRNDMEEAAPDFVVWGPDCHVGPAALLAMTRKETDSNLDK